MESEIYDLLAGRIRELNKGEIKADAVSEKYVEYIRAFVKEEVTFTEKVMDLYEFMEEKGPDRLLKPEADRADLEKIKKYNHDLYEQILPENYANSYVNPMKAACDLGEELGRGVAVVAAEMRAMIPAAFRCDRDSLAMRLELFLEVYSLFNSDETDDLAGRLKNIVYDYVYDYCEKETLQKLTSQIIPGDSTWAGLDFATTEDDRILYLTGEYVGDNETRMYRYLKTIPEEKLKSMAATYVGGYAKGFEVTGRDLSKKKTAELRFNIGFLPMIECAAAELKKYGLKSSAMRAGYSLFTGRSVDKNGFFGSNPNPQYDYDHKDDLAFIMDEKLNERRLDCLQSAFEKLKTEAGVYAGPAVIDIFGDKEFEPENKKEAVQHTDVTRKMVTEYASKAGQITNKYIPGDERSFTIIAFPLPSIGNDFEAIFDDTIRINTLDYILYRDIQQKMIDCLDKAEYVCVKGMNENKTDLLVHLHDLTDPATQTNFENCVADVNIPVGEVFTSPVLAGTDGILNVSRVFLNGLEYRNLTIKVKNGKIEEYDCDNGRKLIEDNILYHHETLPMGECAIGTNTTAYEVAHRYGIEAKMPILIAEKTGPHFAFGDTCYSHCEDLKVYNPDGKEIIARENECSALRKTDPGKAYFNCHTDITIPYDELGEVSAQLHDGSRIKIISNGRFVLPGCEELNKPLEKGL